MCTINSNLSWITQWKAHRHANYPASAVKVSRKGAWYESWGWHFHSCE